MARHLTPGQRDDLIDLYRSGKSQNELAALFGIRQASVHYWIKKRGAQITRGEAESRKWATMSAERRAAQVAAAHDAVRGSLANPVALERRALARQATLSSATGDEMLLVDAIEDAGLRTVPQQAIGKYNIDIAVAPVAVELFGGGWHAYGRHAARLPERVKHIADAGWNLMIIWTHTGARGVFPLHADRAAQDVLAYVERSKRDPTYRRQYRVIWGTGQLLSAGCVDDDQLTLIPSAIDGAYRTRR